MTAGIRNMKNIDILIDEIIFVKRVVNLAHRIRITRADIKRTTNKYDLNNLNEILNEYMILFDVLLGNNTSNRKNLLETYDKRILEINKKHIK